MRRCWAPAHSTFRTSNTVHKHFPPTPCFLVIEYRHQSPCISRDGTPVPYIQYSYTIVPSLWSRGSDPVAKLAAAIPWDTTYGLRVLTCGAYLATIILANHLRDVTPFIANPWLSYATSVIELRHTHVKGTQDWEFFWLRFWNLHYFFVSYVKILRFYKKKFLIGPLLGEVRFFRVVLGLRGMKKKFELGPKFFFFSFNFGP